MSLRERLLDAFESNNVERIKTQLAEFAEHEQSVSLQIKAREILATLLCSNKRISELRETIREFRALMIQKSSSTTDIVVDLRQDVPEPEFMIPPLYEFDAPDPEEQSISSASPDDPGVPFATPVTTPDSSDTDLTETKGFIVTKTRDSKTFAKIVFGNSRDDALLSAVKDKEVTVSEDILYDEDGYVYRIPTSINNGWVCLN